MAERGVKRGQIWQIDFGLPRGSEPGLIRPALIISDNDYNASAIRTVNVLPLTSNTRRAGIPGNVLVGSEVLGLPAESVVNVTQVHTVDRAYLLEYLADAPAWLQAQVDDGLRRALSLR